MAPPLLPRTELWEQLSEAERTELETWIEAQKQALRGGARLNPNWQPTIESWARRVLGDETLQNRPERALRVAEEAVELAQCMGVGADQLHRLVDYVYARPPGTPGQEIAGTLVTLYAAAVSVRVDAEEELRLEVERIHRPEIEEKVRRRQAEKRALVGGGDGGNTISERRFPLLLTDEEKMRYPLLAQTVPWALVAPHADQARRNHGQTLERLAERGGLALCELVAVLEDRPWEKMHPTTSVARLRELLALQGEPGTVPRE